jgi:hypothetical protein
VRLTAYENPSLKIMTSEAVLPIYFGIDECGGGCGGGAEGEGKREKKEKRARERERERERENKRPIGRERKINGSNEIRKWPKNSSDGVLDF